MSKSASEFMQEFLIARLDDGYDAKALYQHLTACPQKINLSFLLTQLISTGRRLENEDEEMLCKARMLIEHGADLNARGYEGETLLMLAAKRHDTLMANFLIEEGSNLNIQDDHGQNILHIACNAFLFHLASLCLARGIDANMPDAVGRTPLHVVFSSSEPEYADKPLKLTELLLSYGASVDTRDKNAMTVLHLFAQKPYAIPQADYEKLTRLFLKMGADPFAVGVDGRTPWMLAKERHNETFLALVTVPTRKGKLTLVPIEASKAHDLIREGRAGIYSYVAQRPRNHERGMCVYAQGEWYLLPSSVIRLVEERLGEEIEGQEVIGDDENHPIFALVQKDAKLYPKGTVALLAESLLFNTQVPSFNQARNS